MAGAQRLRAADEERPAAPQHHGCRQNELRRRRNGAGEMKQAEMSAHLDDKDRHGEHERNPKPPRHVGEFGAIAGAAVFGLERHAADRAGPRSRLPDLRMHRAGIDRARRRGRGGHRGFAQIFFRIGDEFGAAAGAAEMIVVVVIGVMMRALARIDFHAADRIGHIRAMHVRHMVVRAVAVPAVPVSRMIQGRTPSRAS